MHIPDGLMHPLLLALGWLIAVPALAIALRRLRGQMDAALVPRMALAGAGLFAAQMLNFPIAAGTTGHLVGTALATVLLGPAAAVTVVSTLIILQALLFGDGGLLALGLNLTNMAVVAALVAAAVHRVQDGRLGAGLAAWASVVAASLLCAAELGLSHALDPTFGVATAVAVPLMGAYHALIGLGEAAITVAVLAVAAPRPTPRPHPEAAA